VTPDYTCGRNSQGLDAIDQIFYIDAIHLTQDAIMTQSRDFDAIVPS
jgi:hypothetical protein